MADRPSDNHRLFDRTPSGVGASNLGIAIAITTTEVLRPRKERRRVILINNGANTVYVCLGATAAVNTGIRLNASGGSYVIEADSLGYLYTGPISAIASGGVSTLVGVEE